MHTGRGHGPRGHHGHHGHGGRGGRGWGGGYGWGYGYPWAAYPYAYVNPYEPWWIDDGVIIAGMGRLGQLGTAVRQNLGTNTIRSGCGEIG